MEASALPTRLTRGRAPLSAAVLRVRSDDQLVALFRAGSDDAFRAIHDRYRSRLLAYARQMLRGAASDPEDALQDVFLRAYRSLRASNRPVMLRAWLYRIAHNRCIDELRRPHPVPSELDPDADSAFVGGRPNGEPSAVVERGAALTRLLADVQSLPSQQRSALLMRELQGLSYEELANALAVSVPAVKSLLLRARTGLVDIAIARDTPCAEIREELISASDRSVRISGRARRHCAECPSCGDYRGELKRVRRGFGALAPPGLLGKLGMLVGIGGGGGAAAGGGGAAAGGGGAAAGGAAAGGGAAGGAAAAGGVAAGGAASAGGVFAGATAAKIAVAVCCAALIGTAGPAVIESASHHSHPTGPIAHQASVGPAASTAAAPTDHTIVVAPTSSATEPVAATTSNAGSHSSPAPGASSQSSPPLPQTAPTQPSGETAQTPDSAAASGFGGSAIVAPGATGATGVGAGESPTGATGATGVAGATAGTGTTVAAGATAATGITAATAITGATDATGGSQDSGASGGSVGTGASGPTDSTDPTGSTGATAAGGLGPTGGTVAPSASTGSTGTTAATDTMEATVDDPGATGAS